MKRKILVAALCCAAIAQAFAGGGQSQSPAQAGTKQVRVGISKIMAHPALDACEQGIQDQLKARGFNAVFDLQSANGDMSTAAQIANKFKSDKVDVAVGIATPTAVALANAIKDVPVVFSAVTDPVSAGLVSSLAHGDGNVTGMSDAIPTADHIAMFKEIAGIKTLGYIYTGSEANSLAALELVEAACKQNGIALVPQAINTSADIRQAAQAIVNRVDGIYMTTDNTVFSAVAAIIQVFGDAKKSIFAGDVTGVKDGGCLIASGFNYYKAGIATGNIVADLLEGKKAADIPVKFLTEPSESDLMFDLDNAKKLGITIPQKYLSQANLIFENGKLTEK
ncbi:ABC transporter substrate-binding protein [Leadbettera azotonutricia]|uniref:ABC transporter, substrate-binding protein n=1 Tax=Leadbettera azotonutricia (strain ATCC BAA-888 / DSM 13862 / ZAS-9) TaxID=545695 RepID=F5YBQ8_LEAAZ|nr:ABC transporter substrate-binding protein [Leadbettera azotonutricia]AEF81577.1 ABC transporter, substrate-binding protein [Leadbettera azotonutricia ZAS-9]